MEAARSGESRPLFRIMQRNRSFTSSLRRPRLPWATSFVSTAHILDLPDELLLQIYEDIFRHIRHRNQFRRCLRAAPTRRLLRIMRDAITQRIQLRVCVALGALHHVRCLLDPDAEDVCIRFPIVTFEGEKRHSAELKKLNFGRVPSNIPNWLEGAHKIRVDIKCYEDEDVDLAVQIAHRLRWQFLNVRRFIVDVGEPYGQAFLDSCHAMSARWLPAATNVSKSVSRTYKDNWKINERTPPASLPWTSRYDYTQEVLTCLRSWHRLFLDPLFEARKPFIPEIRQRTAQLVKACCEDTTFEEYAAAHVAACRIRKCLRSSYGTKIPQILDEETFWRMCELRLLPEATLGHIRAVIGIGPYRSLDGAVREALRALIEAHGLVAVRLAYQVRNRFRSSLDPRNTGINARLVAMERRVTGIEPGSYVGPDILNHRPEEQDPRDASRATKIVQVPSETGATVRCPTPREMRALWSDGAAQSGFLSPQCNHGPPTTGSPLSKLRTRLRKFFKGLSPKRVLQRSVKGKQMARGVSV